MIDSEEVRRDLCIPSLLKANAHRVPNHNAIMALDSPPLTYGHLWDRVREITDALTGMEVRPSDRVAIVLPNGPEMAVSFLCVASCPVAAPLNPAYQTNEFDFYLTDLNARALIIQSNMDSPAREVARQRGVSIIELELHPQSDAGAFGLKSDAQFIGRETEFAGPDDVALVLHTSGTTSRPKIVPLSHKNICTSADKIRSTIALAENDICLNVMPLFHIHGLVGALLSSLGAGAGIACTQGFDAPRFLEWIHRIRPTWYWLCQQCTRQYSIEL